MDENTDFDLEEKFYTADLLIGENKFAEAVRLLNEILAEAPDFGKAHNHLGWLYETRFKDLSRAEEHYRLALKFSPHYTATYYNYSYLLSTLRKYDQLEALLEEAIRVPGISYAIIYNEYGMLREMQGKYDEAIHYFTLHIHNSHDLKSIDAAAESIKRCERKKELLQSR